MKLHILIWQLVFSLVILSCGELEMLQDEKEDEKPWVVTQCPKIGSGGGDGGLLDAPEVPQDDLAQGAPAANLTTCGINTCLTADCSEPDYAATCSWVYAKTQPPIAMGTCQSAGHAIAIVKLEGFANSAQEYQVTVDEKTPLEFHYDRASQSLRVDLKAYENKNQAFQVKYTGDLPLANPDQMISAKVVDMQGKDSCSWLLQLSDGSYVEPVGLDREAKINGKAILVRYEMTRQMVTCKLAKAVVIVEEVSTHDPNDPDSVCAKTESSFKSLLAEIQSEAAVACASDADCVGYGPSPVAGCGGPNFASQSGFAAFEADYQAQRDAVLKSCPMAEAFCDAVFPTKPVCNAEKKCAGAF